MARISVEQKALTDPRFELLARFLESNRHDALGRMVLIWNECQEHNTYTLPERLVGAIMGDREGANWVVEADLAVWIDEETVRIRGTEGRVEWLEAKRIQARLNGKKGGRPRGADNQNETNVGSTQVEQRLQPETPPAPAPAPAQKNSALRASFVPPTIADVSEYVATRTKKIDAARFVDFYTANGWVQGRAGKPIRDWKAAVRTWERNGFRSGPSEADDESHADDLRRETERQLRDAADREKLNTPETDDDPFAR